MLGRGEFAPSFYFTVLIADDSRTDKVQSFEDKVSKVRELLAKDSSQ